VIEKGVHGRRVVNRVWVPFRAGGSGDGEKLGESKLRSQQSHRNPGRVFQKAEGRDDLGPVVRQPRAGKTERN